MALVAALLVGVAAGLLARALGGWATARRQRVATGLGLLQQTGAAPLEEPLARPFAQRVLRPLLDGVGAAVRHLLPQRMGQQMQELLAQAGLVRARPGDWLLYQALSALAAASLALAVLHGRGVALPGAVACLVAGWQLPRMVLRGRAARRSQALRDALPDALDLLTVCVEAGLGFDQALARVAERFQGPLGVELARTLRDQRLGTPRRDAFLALTARVPSPELRSFVQAVLQAEELGVPVGGVLRIQSTELRERRRARAEEHAMQAAVKMLFPMVLLILPALFLVILGPALLQALRTFGGQP